MQNARMVYHSQSVPSALHSNLNAGRCRHSQGFMHNYECWWTGGARLAKAIVEGILGQVQVLESGQGGKGFQATNEMCASQVQVSEARQAGQDA